MAKTEAVRVTKAQMVKVYTAWREATHDYSSDDLFRDNLKEPADAAKEDVEYLWELLRTV